MVNFNKVLKIFIMSSGSLLLIVKAVSCIVIGIESYRVDVEVDTSSGLPSSPR
jgi:hypothetical protein